MKPYTDTEKLELIKKFDKLISDGVPHKLAYKRVGVAQSSIRIWKMELSK